MSAAAKSFPALILVIPRGRRSGSVASIPLHQLILSAMQNRESGIILIIAPPGGGKTFALQHLRAVFGSDANAGFFDTHEIGDACRAADSRVVVLNANDQIEGQSFLDVISLCPWTLDDCVEYAVGRHRDDCRSVLDRLRRDPFFHTLQGSPRLITTVMDAMAADLTLTSSRTLFRDRIRVLIPPGVERNRLLNGEVLTEPLNGEAWQWWRLAIVRQLCRADWIVEQLCLRIPPETLNAMPTSMIPIVAAELSDRPAATEYLNQILNDDPGGADSPTVASLLLAADPNWRPAKGRGLNLSGAQLIGARWAGVDLSGSLLIGSTLRTADLRGANLKAVNFDRCDLTDANLQNADLEASRFVDANLEGANLSGAAAGHADFADTCLSSANLTNTVLSDASLSGTDLSHACCQATNFSRSTLSAATLFETQLFKTNFSEAKLQNVDMSQSLLTSVNFSGAELLNCNLEYLNLSTSVFIDANLYGSLMTGSACKGAIFRGANLSRTGLAEITWEQTDLRGANLTQASFHLGSTRSGLVGSTIAGEGSRTGFYTDDFKDQLYKSPEEIRKACLYGANLLGAIVDRTDFYLVDLRQAVYDETQAMHFEKTGALLGAE